MEVITQGIGTADNAVNFTGNLAGEVTGTQSNTFVSNATTLGTGGTIVRRDASGNFLAGTITANLTGNVTGTANLAKSVSQYTNAARRAPAPANRWRSIAHTS